MADFFQIISAKITAFVTVVIITITSILPGTTSHPDKPVDTSTATPSATVSVSPSPSPLITPASTLTTAPKVQTKTTSTPIPTPVTVIETQPKEVQKLKIDSAVGIEQCRAYTKEKKMVEEKRLNEIYASSQPKVWELAASQNNGQTQAIALKYGDISQEYINKVLGTYNQAIKEGNASEVAAQKAQAALSDFSGYLRDLHNWGVNELKTGNATLKGILDTYENQVYQACLSTL